MEEQNRKRITSQEYQTLRRVKRAGRWLFALVLLVLLLSLFLMGSHTRLGEGLLWACVALCAAAVLWTDLRWRCPKCGAKLPYRYTLYQFSRRGGYTNPKPLPYRCPGCGAEIDLVAVVHPKEDPRC